jgi:hypothetical protein
MGQKQFSGRGVRLYNVRAFRSRQLQQLHLLDRSEGVLMLAIFEASAMSTSVGLGEITTARTLA